MIEFRSYPSISWSPFFSQLQQYAHKEAVRSQKYVDNQLSLTQGSFGGKLKKHKNVLVGCKT